MGYNEREVAIYNLINDDNNMPKLNKIQSKNYLEINKGDYDFDSARDAVLLLCELTKMHKLHAENEYIATYDYNGRLIGLFYVALGDIAEVTHSKRIIATYILLSGGFSFRVFHNHSVDVREPSQGDKMSAYGFKGLASLLGVECKGSYIISRTGYRCVDTNEDYEFDNVDYEWINNIQTSEEEEE